MTQQIIVKKDKTAIDATDRAMLNGFALDIQSGFHGTELAVCLTDSLELAQIALQQEFHCRYPIQHQTATHHFALTGRRQVFVKHSEIVAEVETCLERRTLGTM